MRRPESLADDGQWLSAMAVYVEREPIDAFGLAVVQILHRMPWAKRDRAGDLRVPAEQGRRVVALQGYTNYYAHTIAQPPVRGGGQRQGNVAGPGFRSRRRRPIQLTG